MKYVIVKINEVTNTLEYHKYPHIELTLDDLKQIVETCNISYELQNTLAKLEIQKN